MVDMMIWKLFHGANLLYARMKCISESLRTNYDWYYDMKTIPRSTEWNEYGFICRMQYTITV